MKVGFMVKRFEVLDSLRGLLAVFVVMFHMHFFGSVTELNFFRESYIFVDFFFVLSGFVLAHSYGFKKNNFSRFIVSRFFRLYPLHIFMLFVFVFFELCKFFLIKNGVVEFNSVFKGDSFLFEFISNLFLIHSWSPLANSLSFNAPSWSVSIEFYLYFLFFLLVYFGFKFKGTVWFLISLFSCLLVFFDSNIFTSEVNRGLSCFFSGCVTYVFYRKINCLVFNRKIGTILELFVFYLIYNHLDTDFENKDLMSIVIFCFSILVFSFEVGVFSCFLKNKSFRFLGKISYSIYMTHYAVLFTITSLFFLLDKVLDLNLVLVINAERYLTTGYVFMNNFMVFLILILIVYISNFTYENIEIKFQNFGKKLAAIN
jgi:peptidoglycan/LPS O-acetylase OafA/YrhL